MKFRHVITILASLLIVAILFSIGIVTRYEPAHYRFLGSDAPRKISVSRQGVGWPGLETRFYVIHKGVDAVTADAQAELGNVGWRRLNAQPAVFGRGPHESIDVRSASDCEDASLLAGIPKI